MGALACSPQGGLSGAGDQRVAANAQAVDGADREGALNEGGRYPLSVAPTTWSEREKLISSDGASFDHFGFSVALSGDTALVGAFDDDDASDRSGSAYVFVRSAATWAQQDKLLASDGAQRDSFGYSVSLSGNTALVGAFLDDDAGANSGSAYIFVRNATTWTQQDKLLASDGATDDRFGGGVSLSGDTALVGAWLDDDAVNDSGSTYVFVRSATTWTQQDKLLASDGAAGDWLGYRVSLSGDTALLGAQYDDDSGTSSGSAYVFVRDATAWSQRNKLLASDGAAGDEFGCSVSLNGDTALVGAASDDDSGGASGSAYVFVRSAAAWTQQDKLLASDGAAGDWFGHAVSVSGEMALVGAYGNDDAGDRSGSAYVFVRNATAWSQRNKLVAGDGAEGSKFGDSVSLSSDMGLIGASTDDGATSESGSAYVFALRLVDGQSCSDNDRCTNKFCVESVCCDSPCAGPCEMCNAVGLEGVCTLAKRGTAPASSCGGHLCNGAVGNCPSDCASDEDCSSAHHCPGALSCVPKEPNGTPCGRDGVCLSDHCVDGICCTEACNEGCGSCVLAGSVGTCTPLPRAYAGTPSCTPYLCGGSATSCPSSCHAHSDCAQDGHCSDGACDVDGGQGDACSEDDACTTGHCTDDVCCLVDSCGAYGCGPGGTCESSCSSSAQCASGYSCNSGSKCEAVVADGAAASEGGSCHLASVSAASRRSLPWRGLGCLAALIGLVLARRRHRKGRRLNRAAPL